MGRGCGRSGGEKRGQRGGTGGRGEQRVGEGSRMNKGKRAGGEE
jgi:hypothetical protein